MSRLGFQAPGCEKRGRGLGGWGWVAGGRAPGWGRGTSMPGLPVTRGLGLLLEDGEQRLTFHALLLLQLVELLPQHVLVPLPEPGTWAGWSPRLGGKGPCSPSGFLMTSPPFCCKDRC